MPVLRVFPTPPENVANSSQIPPINNYLYLSSLCLSKNSISENKTNSTTTIVTNDQILGKQLSDCACKVMFVLCNDKYLKI